MEFVKRIPVNMLKQKCFLKYCLLTQYIIPINNRLHDANEIQQRNKTNTWTIQNHPYSQQKRGHC